MTVFQISKMACIMAFIVILLCTFSCDALSPVPRRPVMTDQRQANSCSTTQICYDPATSSMKAEWSGINFGLETGSTGMRGPVGPAGPAGPQGAPGVVDMGKVRDEIKNIMGSYGKTPDESKPYIGDSALEARVSKLEETMKTVLLAMNPTGKPKIKPNVPIVLPDGAIDILGWVPANNGYDYFISGTVSYTEGRKFCELRNATLAVVGIRDREIKKFLLNEFVQKRQTSVWIGLNDIDTEGDWYWEDGVKSTMYNTEWAAEQPDDKFQREDCAYMSSKSGYIADYRCSVDLRALCER